MCVYCRCERLDLQAQFTCQKKLTQNSTTQRIEVDLTKEQEDVLETCLREILLLEVGLLSRSQVEEVFFSV